MSLPTSSANQTDLDLAEIINSDTWTPEQQIQELQRRFMALYGGGVPRTPSSFKPRPTDVIVAVPAKSGTSWVSHICHQLKMQGAEPDFEYQSDIVTWIEIAEHIFKLAPDEHARKQTKEPRLFSSHLPYQAVPKGGKMIYCFRDLKDVFFSAFKFIDSMAVLRGRVSLPVFTSFMIKLGMIERNYENLLDWWSHRHDSDVLFLFFDDLREDHAGCVRKIAKFIGIDCSGETLAHVVHTTTHAEMVRNSAKFEERKFLQIMAKMIGETKPLPENVVGKVRKDGGVSGDGKFIPVDVQQGIDQKWQEIITSKLGFKSLKEMREAWKSEV